MKHEYRSDDEKREFAPGVTENLCPWGWIFSGSRADLIAAGLVTAAMFPGEPGQRKTVAYGEFEGRALKVYMRSRKRFDVFCDATEQERREYRDRQYMARELRYWPGRTLPALDVFFTLAEENPFLMRGLSRRFQKGAITCESAYDRAMIWLSRFGCRDMLST